MRIIIVLLMLLVAAPAWAESPGSFNAAKNLLATTHTQIGHQKTLYCGCRYSRNEKGPGGVIQRGLCGVEERSSAKLSRRLDWEHVVPAHQFGADRQCWKVGHPKCVRTKGRDKGKAYKGRECCNKAGVDPEFRNIHNDPHNLFPAVGEININRKHYPYGEVAGEKRNYGSCDFEFDKARKVAEYSEAVKGEIARALLYMAKERGVKIRYDLDKLEGDSAADPPEKWEIRRAKKIEAATGLRNRFILGKCDGAMTMRCE
jgi:deoxyribonuclease I